MFIKNNKFILFIVILLCISITLTGCYTYFPVTNNDFSKVKADSKLKILLKDKREVIVNNLNDLRFSNADSIIIYQNDTVKLTFSYSEFEKIYQERFDFGKTIFGTFWIAVATIIVIGLL